MDRVKFVFQTGNVKIGYVLVSGINVSKSDESLEIEEQKLFKEIKKRFTLENLSKDKIIDSFRKLYWSFNMDPTKIRVSSEALIRRIIKGENLWRINNIVDTLNLSSAEYKLPLGYVDFDKINGDITVRKAEKNELFVKIGGKKILCKGNEICVTDNNKIIDYGFATADSDFTKVTKNTKNLLVLVYATSDVSDSHIKTNMQDIRERLKKVTGYTLIYEGIAKPGLHENKKRIELKMAAKYDKRKKAKGITASKDKNFSEWYTQLIKKADLADYTLVSGCIVFKPYSYAIWESIQKFFDKKIKKSGVKNAYFPLLIPESLLNKEQKHVEGFTPEVAWVTHAGNTKLNERLAVRPTSETIMYDSYAKWIRSHNDLPLRINQWNNVVRWEFKYAVPFLRTREFLWQEGHTVFATKEEAEKEVLEMLGYYAQVYEDLLAIPVVKGKKTNKEKFAGADYSTTVEIFLPVKKAIQGGTSHFLGQNFSKAFNISFLDENGKKRYAWQNSWGLSTRSIGIMIIVHGDDKGLVLPPKVAPIQIVIIPILFEKTKKVVMKKAREIKKMLLKYSVELDDRESYTPGWKHNEWELKGVPLKIEIGPKDVKNKQVVLVRRDTGEKQAVKISSLKKKTRVVLEDIQKNLYKKAKKQVDDSTVKVDNWSDFLKQTKARKWVKAMHCGLTECEELIKDKTNGIKTNCIPFDQPKKIKGNCVHCNKKAKYVVYFAKSY